MAIQFQHQCVSDLYWVTHSSILLNRHHVLPNHVEYFNLPKLSIDYFKTLDQNPKPLSQHLDNCSTRIGKYFEQLLLFIYKEHHYEKILFSQQVINNKKTIGEFDFILQESPSHPTYHLEVAIKFYLGTDHLNQAVHWLDPNCKDRLDLKFNQLLYQQSQLSTHPDSQAYLQQCQLHQLRPTILMKGYLFIPLHAQNTHHTQSLPKIINPDALKGWWAHINHVPTLLNNQSYWSVLNKPHWLAAPSSAQLKLNPPFTLIELYQYCLDYFNTQSAPILVCELDKTLQEQSRGFITPTHWPF
ncbi:hypothetical protein PsalN5692_03259 [Piscirickettsia salmonis]|uniref:DUF1853 family protein n=1 Tax=Piscirickettsia salmonis TaxID=1238 RepID=UPI0012BA18F1|nr:DUF1853 family protein [Piscirickettsia salmonis]QGP51768.1 hypothetical protein PsalN5692_03259 [Piscirickettsia salmonis]